MCLENMEIVVLGCYTSTKNSCFWRGGAYLYEVAVVALTVVELQEPDGGNDTDEKQKDRRRKPGKQPKVYCQLYFVRVPQKSPFT